MTPKSPSSKPAQNPQLKKIEVQAKQMPEFVIAVKKKLSTISQKAERTKFLSRIERMLLISNADALKKGYEFAKAYSKIAPKTAKITFDLAQKSWKITGQNIKTALLQYDAASKQYKLIYIQGTAQTIISAPQYSILVQKAKQGSPKPPSANITVKPQIKPQQKPTQNPALKQTITHLETLRNSPELKFVNYGGVQFPIQTSKPKATTDNAGAYIEFFYKGKYVGKVEARKRSRATGFRLNYTFEYGNQRAGVRNAAEIKRKIEQKAREPLVNQFLKIYLGKNFLSRMNLVEHLINGKSQLFSLEIVGKQNIPLIYVFGYIRGSGIKLAEYLADIKSKGMNGKFGDALKKAYVEYEKAINPALAAVRSTALWRQRYSGKISGMQQRKYNVPIGLKKPKPAPQKIQPKPPTITTTPPAVGAKPPTVAQQKPSKKPRSVIERRRRRERAEITPVKPEPLFKIDLNPYTHKEKPKPPVKPPVKPQVKPPVKPPEVIKKKNLIGEFEDLLRRHTYPRFKKFYNMANTSSLDAEGVYAHSKLVDFLQSSYGYRISAASAESMARLYRCVTTWHGDIIFYSEATYGGVTDLKVHVLVEKDLREKYSKPKHRNDEPTSIRSKKIERLVNGLVMGMGSPAALAQRERNKKFMKTKKIPMPRIPTPQEIAATPMDLDAQDNKA